MTDAADRTEDVASRLRALEEQPLDQRAAEYVELQETLAAVLESGDARHPE